MRSVRNCVVVSHVTSAEFARSFGCRASQLAWLLGAGASASAGVPTGSDMIADFKTRILLRRHGYFPSRG